MLISLIAPINAMLDEMGIVLNSAAPQLYPARFTAFQSAI
jgi:hypothetical protein